MNLKASPRKLPCGCFGLPHAFWNQFLEELGPIPTCVLKTMIPFRHVFFLNIFLAPKSIWRFSYSIFWINFKRIVKTSSMPNFELPLAFRNEVWNVQKSDYILGLKFQNSDWSNWSYAFWGARCNPTFEHPKLDCWRREVAQKIGMGELFTNLLKVIENFDYKKHVFFNTKFQKLSGQVKTCSGQVKKCSGQVKHFQRDRKSVV